MAKEKKYWESAQYSKLIDYYDFFNENLDKDIESVKDLLSNITQDIHRKVETKRNDSPTNQSHLSQYSKLIMELNQTLLNQHTKRIQPDLALENIQKLIHHNKQLTSGIQHIILNEENSNNELTKLEKSRKSAIQAKNFEKAAYFRDLISTFELINNFKSLSNVFETSSFFVYLECTLYFVIKNHNLFNEELRKIIENSNE